MRRLVLFFGASVIASACVTDPASLVEYDAVAISTARRTMVTQAWTVTLTRAELALGPAYFCASASGSSTLCSTAVAELTSVARFDALAAGSAALGRVRGVTSNVRSVTYDLGILWLATQPQPTAAREALNGHSAVLEGEAMKGDVRVPFVALVDVAPQYQGQHAIATAPAVGRVDSAAYVLEVHVDPVRWLTQIDFDSVAARSERPVVFEAGSQEHTAILVGLKSLAPPEFVWVPETARR